MQNEQVSQLKNLRHSTLKSLTLTDLLRRRSELYQSTISHFTSSLKPVLGIHSMLLGQLPYHLQAGAQVGCHLLCQENTGQKRSKKRKIVLQIHKTQWIYSQIKSEHLSRNSRKIFQIGILILGGQILIGTLRDETNI